MYSGDPEKVKPSLYKLRNAMPQPFNGVSKLNFHNAVTSHQVPRHLFCMVLKKSCQEQAARTDSMEPESLKWCTSVFSHILSIWGPCGEPNRVRLLYLRGEISGSCVGPNGGSNN